MNYKYFIKIIVSAGLLLFFALQIDWQILMHAGHKPNGLIFAAATALIFGQIYFLNLRWHAYLNVGRKKIDFNTSVLINIAGYFANVFLITSIGGIVAKSTLAMRCGISFIHSIFATFLDRFMTLFALIIFSAIAIPALTNVLDKWLLIMLVGTISMIIAVLGIAAFVFRSGFLKNFILESRKRSRLLSTMRMFLENYPLMFKTTVHSLIAQACFILCVYVLSLGLQLGPQHNTIEFLALIPILALISSLPISFGGWGVREGAFIYGLALIGFSMEDAFLLSIQVGFVTLIAPTLYGLFYFLQDKSAGFKALKPKA